MRNTARNRWKAHARKHGEDDEFERLEVAYQKQLGLIQWTIKDASKRHWQAYCSTLSSSSQLCPVWRIARTMSGTSARSSMPNLVTLNNGVKTVHESNEDKVNLLASVYAEVSSDAKYEEPFKTHEALIEAE